jgi:hypothetical protein
MASTPTPPLVWRKSSASGSTNCVEAAAAGGQVRVRDSKKPTESTLTFTADEWQAFLHGVVMGEFEYDVLASSR